MTILEPYPEQPIALPPPNVAIHLLNLADCLCAELAESGAGPTCWCGPYPGAQVSWEGCGECDNDHCGMGYVRVVAGFPYQVFPQPVVDDRCVMPLAWSVEVGALRCLPTAAEGVLDPVAMAEAAVVQMFDARAIYTAIRCCPDIRMAISNYVPVGPEGGCVGGYWVALAPIDLLG